MSLLNALIKMSARQGQRDAMYRSLFEVLPDFGSSAETAPVTNLRKGVENIVPLDIAKQSNTAVDPVSFTPIKEEKVKPAYLRMVDKDTYDPAAPFTPSNIPSQMSGTPMPGGFIETNTDPAAMGPIGQFDGRHIYGQWMPSDPLYGMWGNERYVEHLIGNPPEVRDWSDYFLDLMSEPGLKNEDYLTQLAQEMAARDVQKFDAWAARDEAFRQTAKQKMLEYYQQHGNKKRSLQSMMRMTNNPWGNPKGPNPPHIQDPSLVDNFLWTGRGPIAPLQTTSHDDFAQWANGRRVHHFNMDVTNEDMMNDVAHPQAISFWRLPPMIR